MNKTNEGDQALILLVEDDVQIRRFIRTTLESQGFALRETDTGKEGLELARLLQPAMVILDLGLPDLDGVEVARQLRDWSDLPILVLSARSREDSKVAALDAGADDYLTKPFGVDELMARIRAILRRVGSNRIHGEVDLGEVKVDLINRRITRAGREVKLTPTEYRLLAVLIRNRGRIMTYRHLLKEVWGGVHGEDSHYVRIYMAQLRHKLEDDAANPRYLLTETGVGYRFADT
jgi:two-component system KDP operon response regulator KdpE